jgi:hypothetical protein
MFNHIDQVSARLAARKFGLAHLNMTKTLAKYAAIKFHMKQGKPDRHECQKWWIKKAIDRLTSSLTSSGIALEDQHLNGTFYFDDRDNNSAHIFNHKKPKSEQKIDGP